MAKAKKKIRQWSAAERPTQVPPTFHDEVAAKQKQLEEAMRKKYDDLILKGGSMTISEPPSIVDVDAITRAVNDTIADAGVRAMQEALANAGRPKIDFTEGPFDVTIQPAGDGFAVEVRSKPTHTIYSADISTSDLTPYVADAISKHIEATNHWARNNIATRRVWACEWDGFSDDVLALFDEEVCSAASHYGAGHGDCGYEVVGPWSK